MQLAVMDTSENISWSELPAINEDFDEKSLVAQIIDIAAGIDFGEHNLISYSKWAVFSSAESEIICKVLKPLVGDLQRNQGMGRVTPAWYLQFSRILKEIGLYLRYEYFEPNQPQLCFSPTI